MELIKYIFSSFWIFTGTFMIGYGVLAITGIVLGRILRCVMVLFRGWPPMHLDADGDAVESDNDE